MAISTALYQEADSSWRALRPLPKPIENNAVHDITAWLDTQVTGHVALEALSKTIKADSGHIKHTDLADLTEHRAGLTYGLSHETTSLGGTVTIDESTVTYTPPAGVSNETDYYVYFITDGSGNVGAGVITVEIGH